MLSSTARHDTQTIYYAGLNFQFSENISPDCIDDGAFEVLLDQQATDISSNIIRLRGSMTVSGNHVIWRPFNSPGVRPVGVTPVESQAAPVDTAAAQRQANALSPGSAPAIASAPSASIAFNPVVYPLGLRVTLHGARIWASAADGTRHYLDGAVLGNTGNGLTFPQRCRQRQRFQRLLHVNPRPCTSHRIESDQTLPELLRRWMLSSRHNSLTWRLSRSILPLPHAAVATVRRLVLPDVRTAIFV